MEDGYCNSQGKDPTRVLPILERATRPAILLIGDTLKIGGTEGQFVEVACGLDRSKWDVRVTCLRAEGLLRARLEAAGLAPWSCGPGSFKSPRFISAIWRLARYLRSEKIHLVHCFDFYSNLLGVPAVRLARVPVVIASQRDLGDLRPRGQQWLHGMMLRLATHVFVNTEKVAERLIRARTVPRERLTVIPNGVDLGRFTPGPNGSHRSGSIMIGTLANLRLEKGVEDLVRAVALIRARYANARLVVWGDGPLRPHLDALIGSLGLDGIVELRGSTMEPERVLRELDIFVLPSLSEACSNVLMEAMATGLPVVATNVGGNPALVQDEVTGLLVPPNDPAAIAKAIIRLIEEPGFAATLASQGLARIRTGFGMDMMLKRVESLYDQAAGGHEH